MRWIAVHCQRVITVVAICGITIATTTVVATVNGGWPGTRVAVTAAGDAAAVAETDGCRCLRKQQHAGAL